MEEIAALFDSRGQAIGRAPRSRVRAENLHHGATGIVVFNKDAQIFIHQRTWIKDVYPGRWDFTAGGVIQTGEIPDESAQRELAEELGIDSTLHRLPDGEYSDEHTSYHAFHYWAVTAKQPILQESEVLQGQWSSVEELLARIREVPQEFMPDSIALFLPWLDGSRVVPPTS